MTRTPYGAPTRENPAGAPLVPEGAAIAPQGACGAALDALVADPASALALPPGEARALAIRLAAVLKALELCAARPPAPSSSAPRHLTLPEVAVRTRKSHRWWREHWRAELGHAAKRSGRAVLVPEAAVEQWLQTS